MTEKRKNSNEMFSELPSILSEFYTDQQKKTILEYQENLEGNEKIIMAVAVNYMKKVFETIENEGLKIESQIMGENIIKMVGLEDDFKKIEKTNFVWQRGATGFCDTYYQTDNLINMEFYPFGKDGSLDKNKIGDGTGMGLFVYTLLKYGMENIQSMKYELEFMQLIERGNELGILEKLGQGYPWALVAKSKMNFIPENVRNILVTGKV